MGSFGTLETSGYYNATIALIAKKGISRNPWIYTHKAINCADIALRDIAYEKQFI